MTMDAIYHKHYDGFSNPDTDRSGMKDTIGRFRTNIFHEFGSDGEPLYTMRELPYRELPSAYLIYMYSDSEYEAAMKLVGSWNHWQRLCEIKPFMEGPRANKHFANTWSWTGLTDWRIEKETREKSLAYNQLKTSAEEGNVQAQKLLFEGTGGKRGRPSAEEVKKAIEHQATLTQSIKDDLQRIKNGDEAGRNRRMSA